jgi:hypothetical protein
LPEVQDYLDTDGEPNGNASHRDLLYGHLRALDELVARGPVSDAVVLGALFYAPLSDALDRAEEEQGQDRNKALVQFLAVVGSRISLTRRLSEHLRQLFMAQRHLGRAGTASKKRRRRVAPTSLLKRGFFPDALNLYEVRARALDIGLDEVHEWHQKAKSLGIDMGPSVPVNGEAAEAEEVEESPRPKKKRRRRKRRPGSSPAGAASAET